MIEFFSSITANAIGGVLTALLLSAANLRRRRRKDSAEPRSGKRLASSSLSQTGDNSVLIDNSIQIDQSQSIKVSLSSSQLATPTNDRSAPARVTASDAESADQLAVVSVTSVLAVLIFILYEDTVLTLIIGLMAFLFFFILTSLSVWRLYNIWVGASVWLYAMAAFASNAIVGLNVYFVKEPLSGPHKQFKDTVRQAGLGEAISSAGPEGFFFVLYQILGVLAAVLLLALQLWFCAGLLSRAFALNLELGGEPSKFWSALGRRTPIGLSWLISVLVLSVASLLLTSGLLFSAVGSPSVEWPRPQEQPTVRARLDKQSGICVRVARGDRPVRGERVKLEKRHSLNGPAWTKIGRSRVLDARGRACHEAARVSQGVYRWVYVDVTHGRLVSNRLVMSE